jgi:hypothetical protein
MKNIATLLIVTLVWEEIFWNGAFLIVYQKLKTDFIVCVGFSISVRKQWTQERRGWCPCADRWIFKEHVVTLDTWGKRELHSFAKSYLCHLFFIMVFPVSVEADCLYGKCIKPEMIHRHDPPGSVCIIETNP